MRSVILAFYTIRKTFGQRRRTAFKISGGAKVGVRIIIVGPSITRNLPMSTVYIVTNRANNVLVLSATVSYHEKTLSSTFLLILFFATSADSFVKLSNRPVFVTDGITLTFCQS